MKKVIGIGAAFFALALTLFPAVSITAAQNALSLCMDTLVPSLFPFFVCANLLISSGITARIGRFFEKPSRFLFRVGGEGAASVFLGFISGYPAGAAVTCRLYANGSISRDEAHRLLAFTNNAGPLFIIGAVGTALYERPMVGYLLLAAQTLASLITGVCMRFFGGSLSENRSRIPHPITDPVGDAVHTVLNLCGYVLFFSAFSAFLDHIGILRLCGHFLGLMGMGEKTASLCLNGLLEISAVTRYKGALPATAALLSFGGLSVLLQTASLVKKAGLSIKSYVLGKILSAGCSAFFCRLLLPLFSPSVSVSALSEFQSWEKAVFPGGYSLPAVRAGLVICLLFLCRKKLQKNTSYGTIKKKGRRSRNDYILQ